MKASLNHPGSQRISASLEAEREPSDFETLIMPKVKRESRNKDLNAQKPHTGSLDTASFTHQLSKVATVTSTLTASDNFE